MDLDKLRQAVDKEILRVEHELYALRQAREHLRQVDTSLNAIPHKKRKPRTAIVSKRLV